MKRTRSKKSRDTLPLSSFLSEPKAIKGCGAKDYAQLGSKLLRYYTSVIEVTRSRMQAMITIAISKWTHSIFLLICPGYNVCTFNIYSAD
jgi:hypothetical protein